MRLRRTLSAALALTFLIIVLPHAGAFADTAGHRAEAAIERWSGYGIIMGYDGSFRPDDPIPRAEMAVIIDRMVSYRLSAENTYRDLDEGWYTEAVLKASAAGVIQGTTAWSGRLTTSRAPRPPSCSPARSPLPNTPMASVFFGRGQHSRMDGRFCRRAGPSGRAPV